MRISADNKTTAAAECLRAIKDRAASHRNGRTSDNRQNIKRIASLSDKLANELREINRSATLILRYRVESSLRRIGAYDDLLCGLEELGKMARFKPRKRARHRPRGTTKVENREVQDLILALHRIARKYGGKLTLGMNISARKPSGTLPAILGVLQEVLPSIIPTSIPYQTLRRMRQHAIALDEPRKTPLE